MAVKRNKNKKAMFFSLIAVLMGTIFAISFEVMRERHFEENKLSSTKTRVEVLNNFVNDFDDRYFERMLYVSSKAALQSLGEYRKPLPNGLSNALPNGLTSDFKTVVLKGEIGNSPAPDFPCSNPQSNLIDTCKMRDYKLTKFRDEINNIFKGFGIDTNKFDVEITEIEQSDAWHVDVTARLKYAFKDDSNIASWEGETVKTVSVNIDGIYGPNTAVESDVIKKGNTWTEASASCEPFLRRIDPSVQSNIINPSGANIGIRPENCPQDALPGEECCNPS